MNYPYCNIPWAKRYEYFMSTYRGLMAMRDERIQGKITMQQYADLRTFAERNMRRLMEPVKEQA